MIVFLGCVYWRDKTWQGRQKCLSNLRILFFLQSIKRDGVSERADWSNDLPHSQPANQISSLPLGQVGSSRCRVGMRGRGEGVTLAGHRLLFNPTTGRLEQRRDSPHSLGNRKSSFPPVCSTPTPPVTFVQIRLFNRVSFGRKYNKPNTHTL